jgi:acetate kinase
VRVLVVNTGSSSLKLSVLDDDALLRACTVEKWLGEEHLDPVRDFLASADGIDAVGHRIVHGGPRLRGAVRLVPEVLAYLESITDLAPLHLPRALAAVRAVEALLPGVTAVACFDTSFHATLPDEAATYALPREWNARWGLRRYGFHGLSHGYAAARAAELLGRPLSDLRMVTCHLGAGASLAAIRGGRSIDTTMGFTPLAGLVMVTRSGSVDPGMLLWLLRHGGIDPGELGDALEHRSGMAGLSGTSGDLREVLAARDTGDADAALAFDVFCHRLAREVAGMAASAGGLDALVLTGGIGEHSPEVRADLAERLRFLGVAVDPQRNAAAIGDRDISTEGAQVSTVVVCAREDLEVARQTIAVLRSG